jgi:uncharacterized membrane protein YheB (UPF0754 family)
VERGGVDGGFVGPETNKLAIRIFFRKVLFCTVIDGLLKFINRNHAKG